MNYVTLKVADMDRSGRFYDSVLAPLGWRRQEASETAVGWGLTRSVFFVELDESQRPGFGHLSFPARSIPAVKAAYQSGLENGAESAAEPGSAPLHGPGTYCARLLDPDGYLIQLVVAHD